MATMVFYRFRSSKNFTPLPIDGPSITLCDLKQRILVSNFSTILKEEDSKKQSKFKRGGGLNLVFSNPQTGEDYGEESTLIPKNAQLVIRRAPVLLPHPIVAIPQVEQKKDRIPPAKKDIPQLGKTTEEDLDDFGDDVYTNVRDHSACERAEEDRRLKDYIHSYSFDSQSPLQHHQGASAIRRGTRLGFGIQGGFTRLGFQPTPPPQAYLCHRCKRPGHYIHNCPTNYDKKRVISTGAIPLFKPDEAAFEKQVQGLPSTRRSLAQLPPELHCPLCKQVMKDAALTSKCCFSSFCDPCIREHIITKSMCACGERNVMADDILPNITVRNTIKGLLESDDTNTKSGGSSVKIVDRGSACLDGRKAVTSTASKGGQIPPAPKADAADDIKQAAVSGEPTLIMTPQQTLEIGSTLKAADSSEATLGSKLQVSAFHAGAELNWITSQDFPVKNYMIHTGRNGFMDSAHTCGMPYIGYPPNPFDVHREGAFPQHPAWGHGQLMPVGPPQRDLSGYGMSRDDFKASEPEHRRKCEKNRRGQSRECFKESECGRELSNNVYVTSLKLKSRIASQQTTHNNRVERTHHRQSLPREATELIGHGNKRAYHHGDKEAAEADKKLQKEGSSKKRKSVMTMEQDSSDDEEERNFKRMTSWY